MPSSREPLEEQSFGASTVLFGVGRGKYPDANSLLVRGPEQSLLIDPALGIVERHRRGSLPGADRILLTHCHEDHLSGLYLYPDLPVEVHHADRPGLDDLDAMMAIYGYPEPRQSLFRKQVVERFHYVPRPDAGSFGGDTSWDLGGGVKVHAIHAPGHTRGHSLFLVEPDGLLFLADVDLSSFGPYYGDAWSSLEDFDRTLEELREVEAGHFVAGHHKGLIGDRPAFLEALARYAAVIVDRDERLLAFLDRPRTLDEVVAHRFVYRPQDPPTHDPSERRHMSQHLDRLVRQGRVEVDDEGSFSRSDRR